MSKSRKYDQLYLSLGSTRNISHNVSPLLEGSTQLSSISSVEDVTDGGNATGDLTISNLAVSTADYVEDVTGDTVTAGSAVQFSISTSRTTPKWYQLKLTFETSASPPETIIDYLYVRFE